MTSPDPGELSVSLVIPGRNAAATLERCLRSVVALKESQQLADIFFVDDGSSDESLAIADKFPVRCLEAGGRGPGAARNTGWRSSTSDLVWFIDADCVARDDALELLLAHMKSPSVAAAGGSYTNLYPNSLLASLIHLEIVERHSRMPQEPDFLASFNVLYRREDLERVGGFDERLRKAQDADLAFRVRANGGVLRFDGRSRVGHHHPIRLKSYLATQAGHGFWRVFLYAKHPRASLGDTYSNWLDHLQPVLALLLLASTPFAWWQPVRWWMLGVALGLAALALPMGLCLVRRGGSLKYWSYVPFAVIRALARGLGMATGVLGWLFRRGTVGS